MTEFFWIGLTRFGNGGRNLPCSVATLINFFATKYRQLDELVKKRNMLRLEARRMDISDQGFEIIDPKANRVVVSFSKVCCINAFKRDLFTFDQICLEFYLEDCEKPTEINEFMEGYDVLVGILPSKFEGFDQDWLAKVFKPAFVPNFTELWSRKP